MNAQQIYKRMQMEVFLLFQVKLAVKIKTFCVKSKKNTLIIHIFGQTRH